jgi:hypothetical protein
MATAQIYNNALLEMAQGTLNFPTTTTPTYKVMLIGASPSYTFSKTHVTIANVKAAGATEVSGTGYVAGGSLIPSPGIATALNANAVEVSITDVVWGSSTITARGAILYAPTGNDATAKVIAYVDFGANVSSSNSAFTIDFQTPLKLQN